MANAFREPVKKDQNPPIIIILVLQEAVISP